MEFDWPPWWCFKLVLKGESVWNMWSKLVDIMNCIRKMNSYTTSFTYSLAIVLFLEEN